MVVVVDTVAVQMALGLFCRERVCDWRRRFPSRRSGSVSRMTMADGRWSMGDSSAPGTFSTRSAQQRRGSLFCNFCPTTFRADCEPLTANGLARISLPLQIVFATGIHCTLDPCKTSPNSNQEKISITTFREAFSRSSCPYKHYFSPSHISAPRYPLVARTKLEHELQSSSSHRQLTDYTLTTAASNFAHSYTQH